jgi:hypothetical protein
MWDLWQSHILVGITSPVTDPGLHISSGTYSRNVIGINFRNNWRCSFTRNSWEGYTEVRINGVPLHIK